MNNSEIKKAEFVDITVQCKVVWTKTSSVMPSIPYKKYISSVNIAWQWWKSLIKWSIVNRLLDTKQIIVVIIY